MNLPVWSNYPQLKIKDNLMLTVLWFLPSLKLFISNSRMNPNLKVDK